MINYDITFCSNTDCKQECFRNQNNINKMEIIIRNGIWIGNFNDCEHFKDREVKN